MVTLFKNETVHATELLGFNVPLTWRRDTLRTQFTAEALQSFLSRMVKRGGAYRWSCENLNGGFPPKKVVE